MTLTRKIARNTFCQIFGRGVGLFFSLISLGLMMRYLGVEGFGHYTTIFAFLQLFNILADFGLTLMAVQLISEIKDDCGGDYQERINNIFSNVFTLRLVLTIVLLGLAFAVVWFFPYPVEVKYGVLIAGAAFLFISLTQILQSVFQKNLQMRKSVIADVIAKSVFLAGVYGVTIQDWNLYGILGFLVLTQAIYLILMYCWSREFVKVGFLIQWSVWKDILRRSWPLALSIIFNLIYLKADILILSLYYSQDIVGIYGAAYRAIDVLTVFPYLFIGLVLPLLSAAWARADKEYFTKVTQRGFEALTVIAVPLVIGVVFLAEPIIVLIAGKDFSDSGSVLKILIIALGMIYLGNIFTHGIVAINKQKKMMWVYLTVAATSLVGYFILIPRYSYWGAAGVTLYSETAVTILAFIMVIKTVGRRPNFTVLFKSLIAAGAMAIFLWLAAGWNLFVIIPVAILIYGAVMLLIGGIDRELIEEVVRLK